MIQLSKTMLTIWLYISFGFISLYAQIAENPYVNDMDYMIADVKQAFIQDKISTDAQVENLLKGLKKMKVNGIRVSYNFV